MEAHEAHERMHEAAHHGGDFTSKRIALLIGFLAVLLAIVEMGGKSAQTMALAANIEAADLWSFYQAKAVRSTVFRTAAELLETTEPAGLAADKAEQWTRKAKEWHERAQHEESSPQTGDGRKELATRAQAAEARRDRAFAAYHSFEFGAAALEIAIVLASSAVVTGVLLLAYVAGGLGVVGLAFGMIGWFAPTILQFH